MLINNTKRDLGSLDLGSVDAGFLRVMDDIFGQKPNIENL